MALPVTGAGLEVRSLFRRGSVYTVASAVQLSVGVLVLPIVTRLVGPADFGVVTAALVVQQILTFIAAFGLPYAVTIEFFRARDGLAAGRALVAATAGVALAIVVPLDLLGPIWADQLFGDIGYALPLRLGVWSAVPFAVVLSAQALLRSREQSARFVVVALLTTVGAQLCGVAGVALGETPSSYMLGEALGLVLAAAVGALLSGIDVGRLRDRELVLASVRLGATTIPHALAIYVIAAGDRIVVESQLGAAAVGRYQVAYLVGALGLTVVSAFNNAWSPLVYGAPEERRWHVLAETTAALYRGAGYAAAAIALGGPAVMGVLAPGEYSPLDLAPVTAVVAVSIVPYIGYLANAHPIFFHRRTLSLAWITPLSATCNIALCLLLLPRLGLVGTAYATVAAYALQAVLAARARRRIVRVDWLPRSAGRAWAIAVAGALAGAVLPVSATWLALRALAAAACLAMAAMAVRSRRS